MKKRGKKSSEKDAAAEKKQVRDSTKNYVRGSNKEKEDLDLDELLDSKPKKQVEPKEKIDEDSAFLSYVKHLFSKKIPTDADKRLVELLSKVVIGPAYQALDASAKKEFVLLWEEEIVKNDYDHWRTDTSGRCKWYPKITPYLHLRVILDKIEHQQNLSAADISQLAGVATK